MPPDAAADVFHRLIRLLPPGRAYGTADFAAGALPGPVAHFLAQALARRLDLERDALRAARTPWFDYDAPAVEAAEARFLSVLGVHARIPADDWPHALEQAVRQVVPHLVQPARTLAAFVYSDGAAALPAPVVERRMAYFAPYPYLRDAVSARVQQKGIGELSAADFAALLQHVERQAPAAFGPEAWASLLGGLFETLGEGPEGAVPGALLARFFAEKGMDDAARRFGAEGRVLAADVPRFLREAGAAEPAAPAAVGGTATPYPTPRPDAPASAAPPATAPLPLAPLAPLDEPPAPSPRAPEPPLPPELSAPPTPASLGAPAEAPAPAPGEPAFAPAAPAPSFWERFGRGRAEPPLGDAGGDDEADTERAVLGEAASRRRAFVDRLFGGDEAAYRATLRRLEAARTWPDASAILVDAFRAHRVNLYDSTAVAFTDATEARFLK